MKVGLFLLGDYNWAGGVYYLVNLVKTLRMFPGSSDQQFVLFYNNKTPGEILAELNGPDVKLINLDDAGALSKLLNKVSILFRKKGFRIARTIRNSGADFIFPLLNYEPEIHNCGVPALYWLYDFQHKLLPELFTDEELMRRENNFRMIAERAADIVVSSHDAASHFKKFYPSSASGIHVYQFASIISYDDLPSLEDMQRKYKVDGEYFIVCNQFWKHKNHMSVLKALASIKNELENTKIILTGKRNPEDEYTMELQKFINENKLEEHIIFTGFIPRNDQLALMHNSLAVIQPSRFEGWSTVVEDAKALNKLLFLSDLSVHREQMPSGGFFFETGDYSKLALLMKNARQLNSELQQKDYRVNIKSAAEQFTAISKSVTKRK